MDIVERLIFAEIASCNCDIKTHDVEFHSEQCPYRLYNEASAEITRLRDDRDKASTLLMLAWHFVRETELVEGERHTMLWEQALKLRKEIDDFIALIERDE